MSKPQKKSSEELFLTIQNAIESNKYYFTGHAMIRSRQRLNVDRFIVIKILKGKAKYHEPKKDFFSSEFNSWNYSIRGKTIDNDNVRIIVSFDQDDLLIITVINLDELN